MSTNNLNPTLTSRGLRVRLKSLSRHQRKKIETDLIVQPEQYIGEALPYHIFEYDSEYVWIPRYYGIKEFGNDNKQRCVNRLLPGERREFEFTFPNFQLKPIQTESLKYLTKSLIRYGTGILKLECGVGKTVTGLYLISRLKTKTLVVVHRLNLLNQWRDEIQRFTNAKVGLLHRDKINVDDVDIVLTTVHCVINHTHNPKYAEIYKRFGLMMIDEAHHFSSREFHRTLKVVGTKYVVGLTATPKKGERTKISHVFKKFIGPIVPPAHITAKYTSATTNRGNVIVNVLRYAVDGGDLSKHLSYTYRGQSKSNVAGMITNIGKNDDRNRVIIHYIRQLIQKPKLNLEKTNIPEKLLDIINDYYIHNNFDSRRNVLIVADRKRQLRWLCSSLKKIGIDAALYIGGLSNVELAKSKKSQVILGTYSVCEEGLNIPKINSVMLVSPRRDCEQSIGRGFRKAHPIPVIIIDIIDAFSKTFLNQGSSRKRYYRNKAYDIVDQRISDCSVNKLPELKLSI